MKKLTLDKTPGAVSEADANMFARLSAYRAFDSHASPAYVRLRRMPDTTASATEVGAAFHLSSSDLQMQLPLSIFLSLTA